MNILENLWTFIAKLVNFFWIGEHFVWIRKHFFNWVQFFKFTIIFSQTFLKCMNNFSISNTSWCSSSCYCGFQIILATVVTTTASIIFWRYLGLLFAVGSTSKKLLQVSYISFLLPGRRCDLKILPNDNRRALPFVPCFSLRSHVGRPFVICRR